ncbi:phage GP46 family protein [Salmonella enterica]|nr:phage GP46 family protein [Salmonella enterica]
MSDIRTVWVRESQEGEWQISAGDLVTGGDLETAMIISLFTDRQAREDDDVDDGNRRGWWGDAGHDYDIGSRLWLLQRRKLTVSVARRAEDYAREALQWLLDDGVVGSLDIQAQIVWPSYLILTVHYHRPDNQPDIIRFYWQWGKSDAIQKTNTD